MGKLYIMWIWQKILTRVVFVLLPQPQRNENLLNLTYLPDLKCIIALSKE